MDEFDLIDTFFKSIVSTRSDVVRGIGDDAACLSVPFGQQLLVSCDTLVVGKHFLDSWDPYDIATRAVRVNVSDIAAMGGTPTWMMLALTLPSVDEAWLRAFSRGLTDALNQYGMALIGGDTTQGPLSMTLTIHGLVPEGQAVYRHGAQVGDLIYVSGDLGAAALAIDCLDALDLDEEDRALMMEKLLRPEPRIDLSSYLRTFATAAIDISDGLSADLFHLCQESFVGAKIWIEKIPIHPLVQKYLGKNALDFALGGGDDYELCFTVASKDVVAFEAELAQASKKCYPIGIIDAKMGLLALYDAQRPEELLIPRGYSHF